MRIDILTLFPEMVSTVLSESIIGRAQSKGAVEINCVNIRDYTHDKHRRVDDYPYGGGSGMVMQAEPIYNAYKSLTEDGDKPLVLYMSPQGRVLDQSLVKELADIPRLMVLCGHYEGVDERIIEEIVDMEVSLGDFVLTGGEIPAIALCDAVCRLVPGVLSRGECFADESHYNGLLEYPQYTRPPEFRGRRVPDVLLSGHFANITKWRHEQSLERTRQKRPDLL
ncbi:tRNA (guanine-N(1)-)-methyltransferase [Clostridia bacterium]|nr:tRNA (guanine-N(1)-)-methyltransferase [Clostridia bacterium]